MKISALGGVSSFGAANFGAKKSNKPSLASDLSQNQSINPYPKGISPNSYMVSNDWQTLTTSTWNIDEERRLSKIAISKGVDTPKIAKDRSYLIRGQRAQYPEVQITDGHIKNVLKNLLIMDENKIFHGDVEHGHVFYSQNSPEVAFDCFKFGCIFDEDEKAKGWMRWEFPPTIYPTNIMQYEHNCIGHYINQMDDEETKNDFISMYLKEAAGFHQKRAEHLERIDAPLAQQNYEITKSKVYKNADDDVIKLFRKRVEFKNMERNAFTKVDEGKGAGGHPEDEGLVIEGITDYMDTMQATIDYIDLIDTISSQCDDADKKKYLSAEADYAKFWLSHYAESVSGNAGWSLNPDNPDNKEHTNVDEDERNELAQRFAQINKTDDRQEQTEIMAGIKKYFNSLVNKQ